MSVTYKKVPFGNTKTEKVILPNGIIHYKNTEQLGKYPERITDKLIFWAKEYPERTFIARRNHEGGWKRISYAEALRQVKVLGQFLLNQRFDKDQTLVILSENSLEHAMLSLAALYVGITYSPISPPYSLVSDDFSKLKHCLEIMTPKVIFAQSEKVYRKALDFAQQLCPTAIILTADNEVFTFEQNAIVTGEVDQAHAQVHAETVAKVLFTSGSTGLPKGVMNHHGMWCANLQQITQVFPFLEQKPPVFIDWLPWNHTFGGNHNFGLTLYNGGTLYIDEGKPTAKGIEQTIKNLKEISPTAYFNVPKGFEMLIPYFDADKQLRDTFFKHLHILFYAGASLAQPVWDKWEALAAENLGEMIPIITGLGCTESGPSAMFANWGGAFSGLLGVPVAGMDVKLVPDGDKLEARYRAPNVTRGYWRNQSATEAAFDQDGYYKTGDAVKFLDESDPDKGLVFDGRIAEDFKLSTGTWVNVGVLKAKVLSSGSPLIQDVVIAGLDKEYIGVILFLNHEYCLNLTGCESLEDAAKHEKVHLYLDQWKEVFNAMSTGSSTRIERYVVAIESPSIDLGEITDKGSLNQRAVLKNRQALVKQLFN